MDERTAERVVVHFELEVVLGENEGDYGCEYSFAIRDQDVMPEALADEIAKIMLAEALAATTHKLREEIMAAHAAGTTDEPMGSCRAERRRAERSKRRR